MTGVKETRLCFSSNVTGIVVNEIEQKFYSVYSYSGIESIEHALNHLSTGIVQMPVLIVGKQMARILCVRQAANKVGL